MGGVGIAKVVVSTVRDRGGWYRLVVFVVMEESCQLEYEYFFRPHSPMTCTSIGGAPRLTKKGPSPQPYFTKVGRRAM